MPYTDDPQNSQADQVRFFIGDTDNNNLNLTDAQVTFLLATETSPMRAAARAAEILAAKFTKVADEKRVGPLRIRSATSTADAYAKLAKRLWARAATADGAPFAGGISITDKNARIMDGDSVRPTFARRMMRYPDVSNQSANLEELKSPSEQA